MKQAMSDLKLTHTQSNDLKYVSKKLGESQILNR